MALAIRTANLPCEYLLMRCLSRNGILADVAEELLLKFFKNGKIGAACANDKFEPKNEFIRAFYPGSSFRVNERHRSLAIKKTCNVSWIEHSGEFDVFGGYIVNVESQKIKDRAALE